MNRKSLFGRLANSTKAVRSAERQEYFRANLEPLEDRKMLAVLYVSQSWTDTNGGTLQVNDPVTDPNTSNSGTYGTNAFGTTAGGSFVAGNEYIASAIANAGAGDTVEIEPGTYEESDIVITKGITLTGTATKPTIVPQLASADTTGDFPASTHSGIIIYSGDVTVKNLIINGTGNGFTRDFHQGITTLYNAPSGLITANQTDLGTLGIVNSITEIQLGATDPDNANGSIPNLLIDGVQVQNTFWHGITVSARADKSFNVNPDTKNLIVRNSTVTDVGDTKDVNRVGILLQNIGQQTSGVVNLLISSLPNAYFNTVSNVGVGIKTTSFGTLNYGNDNAANNGSAIAVNLVNQAQVYGYEIHDSDFQLTIGNRANYTGTNSATGIYIRNSEPVYSGLYITGYHTGMQVQEAWPESPAVGQRYTRIALRTLITGPGGSADPTSVGILVNNAGLVGSVTNDSTALLIGAADVTGFGTGIKVVQETNATDGRKNRVYSLDANLSGNTVGVEVGNNSIFEGTLRSVTASAIKTVGNGQLVPKVFNYDRPGDAIYITNPSNSTPLAYAPDTADIFAASSVTLGSSSTYKVQITGETTSSVWQNFSDSVSYASQLLGIGLGISNGVFPVTVGSNTPIASGGDWGGDVLQVGDGSLVLGGDATGGTGVSGFYRLFGSYNPSNSSQFLLQSTDFSNKTYINISAKLDAASTAEAYEFILADRLGNAALYPIPLPGPLNSSTFTTFGINLRSPAIMLSGDHLDLTNIVGYNFFGENGLIDLGGGDVATRMSFDDFTLASLPASNLKSSGSINLGGATLGGDVRSTFTPSNGQQFKIIDNTAAVATKVTGTFAGLAQGATLTISGKPFTIDYSGGDGNDVMLTKVAYTSTVTGRRLFYKNSGYDLGFLDDNSAIATDKVAYIPNGSNTVGINNVSSYVNGINGIMVDLTGSHGTITAADFNVKMSQQNLDVFNTNPSAWAAAPSFTVVSLGTFTGASRYELIWADGAITNRYVEVITKGNDALGGNNENSGLATSDYFFYGNMVGESFNNFAGDGLFVVDQTDEIATRFNQGFYGDISFIQNLFDYNRDFAVDQIDEIIARFNGNFMLAFSTTNPPNAPSGGDGSGSAVASALAASGSSSGSSSAAWVEASLSAASSSSAPSAAAVAQLMEADAPDVGDDDSADDDSDDEGEDA